MQQLNGLAALRKTRLRGFPRPCWCCALVIKIHVLEGRYAGGHLDGVSNAIQQALRAELEMAPRGKSRAYQDLLAGLDDSRSDVRILAKSLLHRPSPGVTPT